MADKTGTDDTTAVEIGTATAKVVRPSGDDTGSLPHHGFFSRLYTGTGAFEVIVGQGAKHGLREPFVEKGRHQSIAVPANALQPEIERDGDAEL